MTARQSRGEAVALPEVPVEHFHIFNAIFRRRPPINLRLGGRYLQLSPTWLAREPAIADACTVTFRIDGGQGELVLAKAVLDAVFAGLDPSLSFDGLDPSQRVILLEHALTGAMDAMEAGMGCALSAVNVAWGAGRVPGAGNPAIPFSVQINGLGQSWALLRLTMSDVERLAHYLDTIAGPDDSLVDLPVPLRVRWGAVSMTLGELYSLMPGDIVLVDRALQQNGVAVAVAGEHFAVPVNLTPEGCRIAGQPRRARGTNWEWSLDRLPGVAETPVDARLEDLPVQVLFELGRADLALSDIPRLRPGEALPFAASDAALDIVVNGERIGRGEPAQLGEALAVRVTRLAVASQ